MALGGNLALLAVEGVAIVILVGLVLVKLRVPSPSVQRVNRVVLHTEVVLGIIIVGGGFVIGGSTRGFWEAERRMSENGTMMAERENVQTAMMAFMVDQRITEVLPMDTPQKSFTSLPKYVLPNGEVGTSALADYLKRRDISLFLLLGWKGQYHAPG